MDVYTENIDGDTGTIVFRFGRDEGFRVEYDDGAAEVRFGLFSSEAAAIISALVTLAESS